MPQRCSYEDAIGWIVRNRAGQGGWPPRDVSKVAGWLVVLMVADLFSQSPRVVALDIIDYAEHR
jgi:hypothetical protein